MSLYKLAIQNEPQYLFFCESVSVCLSLKHTKALTLVNYSIMARVWTNFALLNKLKLSMTH